MTRPLYSTPVSTSSEKPIFSGLVLFNEEVETGVEYNGRVILEKALDVERSITLKSGENQFTIQMGSDNGGAKNHTRFVYRLKGFNDKWIKTTALSSDITYMGLPAGHYTLCVRMLNDDGTMGEIESQLDITIRGPWYTSWWAIILWLALVVLAGWYAWKYYKRRKQIALLKENESEDSLVNMEYPEEEEIEEAILMDDDELKM